MVYLLLIHISEGMRGHYSADASTSGYLKGRRLRRHAAEERFVKEADANAKSSTPKLSAERKARLDAVLRNMSKFQF